MPSRAIAPKRRGGTSRRTASDTSGIGTPSPPGYFGNINQRVTSAGTGTTATTRGVSPRLHVGEIPWHSGVGTGRRG